jgi:hypothetical protein
LAGLDARPSQFDLDNARSFKGLRATPRPPVPLAGALRLSIAMRMSPDRGSALAEALVAALLLTTGVLTMAQLISTATRSNVSARSTTIATVLAAQKLEQLRALTWGFGPAGVPLTDRDTDTTTLPHAPTGGTGLGASPPGTLHRNTPGFVDHVDSTGHVVGRGAQPPPQASYTRRWSIEPLALTPDQSVRIQVLVTPYPDGGLAGARGYLPGQARVVTIKTRKAS